MNLRQRLEMFSVWTLHKLSEILGCAKKGSGFKSAFLWWKDVRCIQEKLTNPDTLMEILSTLPEDMRKALKVACSMGGMFSEEVYKALYGEPFSPKKQGRDRYLLALFLQNDEVPDDLVPLLMELLPPLPKYRLYGRGKVKAFSGQKTLEMEEIGLKGLNAVLTLAFSGELKLTKSGFPSIVTYRKLSPDLPIQDYLPLPEGKYKVADLIYPNGLVEFAIGSGMIGLKGEMTELGKEWLYTGNPRLLLEAIENWETSNLADELGRLDHISFKRYSSIRITRASSRRENILEALSWSPAGEWIRIEDFLMAIRLWEMGFQVEMAKGESTGISGAWGYGPLRHYLTVDSELYRKVVQDQYTLAVLWEVLASIGALDVIYSTRSRVKTLDELGLSLSRYSRLKYFRINPLGAYLFGQAGEYEPSRSQERPFGEVNDDLTITVRKPSALPPFDRLLLRSIAVEVDEGYHKLDMEKTLGFLETGVQISDVAGFLERRVSSPLSEAAREWFRDMERRAHAVTFASEARLISVEGPEIAELILQDPKLSRFCKRVGPRKLVIPKSKERSFSKRLKELGYVVPPKSGKKR